MRAVSKSNQLITLHKTGGSTPNQKNRRELTHLVKPKFFIIKEGFSILPANNTLFPTARSRNEEMLLSGKLQLERVRSYNPTASKNRKATTPKALRSLA